MVDSQGVLEKPFSFFSAVIDENQSVAAWRVDERPVAIEGNPTILVGFGKSDVLAEDNF